jgi:AGZA family xanthine/uracil permease-like MFS transporter
MARVRAASIPTYCTGPALILTGALMMINVTKIDWNDINKAVPAFLTISIMPLTYSISYGARPLAPSSPACSAPIT